MNDDVPALTVVGGGDPTAEELAALVVVLSRRPQPGAPAPSRSRWADHRGGVRRPLPHGPGEWQASARIAGVHSV